ncbi:sulfotransferase family protein [Glaciecola sp. 1036]|uniref:sulfotransferase family protein n=1 Tax=Alteromonadaceae TaxID=72275 RepID=UPI003D00A69E
MANYKQNALLCLKALPKLIPLFAEKNYIFIISHMRARTTLISHLLDSSPEIVGNTELHVRYRHAIDELKSKMLRVHEKDYNEARYICDKLLHNRLVINLERYANAKFIFNLRDPEDTFKSLLKRHLQIEGEDSIFKLKRYYNERLIFMESLWDKLNPEQRIYINSDTLIEQPTHVLAELTDFLDLANPLQPEYKTNEHTGQSGKGDMSENIKSGKIIKTKNDLNEKEASLLSSIFSDEEKSNFNRLHNKFQ